MISGLTPTPYIYPNIPVELSLQPLPVVEALDPNNIQIHMDQPPTVVSERPIPIRYMMAFGTYYLEYALSNNNVCGTAIGLSELYGEYLRDHRVDTPYGKKDLARIALSTGVCLLTTWLAGTPIPYALGLHATCLGIKECGVQLLKRLGRIACIGVRLS